MSRRLPLHELHQAAGAGFRDLFGWETVQTFSSVESEYWAVRKSAGLIDLSFSGVFELRGEDRTRFLHGMVTNDIKSLTPGAGCYAAFLSPQGRMISDLRVFCCEDGLILTTEPLGREKLVPGLRKYMIGDRAQLLDRSEELALLSVQGVKANEFLNELLSRDLSAQRPHDHFEATLADARIRVCHVRRSGAGGWDVLVETRRLLDVWSSIVEKGKQQGIQAVGFDGFNIHRIEAGIPWYGLDMDENTLPIEAGLEKDAISFNKGCYIGQESVARITYRGHVNRKLAGLRLSGDIAASKGEKIYKDGQEVGWITSSEYSPSLKAAIALAYVRREVLTPGTLVLVGAQGVSAQVTLLPFSDTGP